MDRRLYTRFRVGALAALVVVLTGGWVRADVLSIVTLGDSITDTYIGKPYAVGNLSWTDQLKFFRNGSINITNLALAGTTSTTLLSQGQDTLAATLIHNGTTPLATLIIGANDIGNFLAGVGPQNPSTVVANLLANVNTAVSTLEAAGNVKLVLGNVPDIGVTPYVKGLLATFPTAQAQAIAGVITSMTQAANQQIAALAQAYHIPVVSLYALNNLSQAPLILGGMDVSGDLYGPDGFHPSSLGAGILANSILDAFRLGYGIDTSSLRLSDQLLLGEANLSSSGTTSLNTNSFVQVQAVPEPSSFLLVSIGALGVVTGRVRRRGSRPVPAR